MIDSNGLIYTLLAIWFWGVCFNIPFCKDRLLLTWKQIELLAANIFITVEILLPEYCLEVIALILEDIRGLVACFENGDTLYSSLNVLRFLLSLTSDRICLLCSWNAAVILRCQSNTTHTLTIKFFLTCHDICSIVARLGRFPCFQYYVALVSLESCCTYCDAFRCPKNIFGFPLRTNQR